MQDWNGRLDCLWSQKDFGKDTFTQILNLFLKLFIKR
jgi:hypothetical protein